MTMPTRFLGPENGSKHRFAARTLMLAVYFAWFCALAVGTLHYDGNKNNSAPWLPLKQFDFLFRQIGGLFLPLAWVVRAGLKRIMRSKEQVTGEQYQWEHIWVPGGMYAFQAGLRSVVYHLHRLGVILQPSKWLAPDVPAGHPPHIMSDHILLAATVVGGLVTEAVVIFMSLRSRADSPSALILLILAGVITILAIIISIESYFTARYFHPPSEIVMGAVVGLVFFQVPLLAFCARLVQAHENISLEHLDESDRPVEVERCRKKKT